MPDHNDDIPVGYVGHFAQKRARYSSDPAVAFSLCPGSLREVSGLMALAKCENCGRAFRQADGIYGTENGVRFNMWLLPRHEGRHA